MTLTKIAPQNLRTPGPTPIPDDIVEEVAAWLEGDETDCDIRGT